MHFFDGFFGILLSAFFSLSLHVWAARLSLGLHLWARLRLRAFFSLVFKSGQDFALVHFLASVFTSGQDFALVHFLALAFSKVLDTAFLGNDFFLEDGHVLAVFRKCFMLVLLGVLAVEEHVLPSPRQLLSMAYLLVACD